MVYFKRWFIKLLVKLIGNEPELLAPSHLNEKQKLDLWANLYENPVFRAYITQRTEQLKDNISDAVMTGSKGNAWIYAGQRLELSFLLKNARGALLRKQDALAKAQKHRASTPPRV